MHEPVAPATLPLKLGGAGRLMRVLFDAAPCGSCYRLRVLPESPHVYPNPVLFPALVEVALVFVLLGLLARTRTAAMRERGLSGKDIALSGTSRCRPARSRLSHCYSNQFEMPVLFLLAVIFGIVLRQTGWLFVLLEWVFIAFRIGHAFVHTTSNIVKLRGMLFLGSAVATALMWILIFIGVFFGTVIA